MNIEQTPDWFVRIDKDGRILMKGGLIFFSGGFLHSESAGRSGHRFVCNHMIGAVPKWWQVFAWVRLVRLIKRHMTPNAELSR